VTDLFVASKRADKDRADIIRQALTALDVCLFPEIDAKAKGSAKATREAVAKARAMLVLWPESILDPTENHGALYGQARMGQEQKKLLTARLDGFEAAKLEPPFDSQASADLSGWLKATERSAKDPGWQALLTALGTALGRPGLAELALAREVDRGKEGEPTLRAFARKYPEDPASVAFWTRIETTERERFASEFRKAHGILVERSNAAQDRLKASLEGFSIYLKAVRSGEAATRPDPKDAIADGATALRDSVARLSGENDRLETALAKSEAAKLAAVKAQKALPLRWAGISLAAFLVAGAAAAGITEFAGPLRGDNHPRIAALRAVAEERAAIAQSAPAEIARQREAARAAARRAETAEANLRVARTQLAHSQTELIQRQNQASEANNQLRRVQSDLQTAGSTSEQRIQEALNRANVAEQEMRTLREQLAAAQTSLQAAQAATQTEREVTGSVPQPQAGNPPQTQAQTAQPPAPAAREVTGSVPPAPPPDMGLYRHRRDRWSFTLAPGFRLESDNDLPGPVNSVMVHESQPDAVIVVSANSARQSNACTPQSWYFENVVEGPRQRRGAVSQDAGLPASAAGFRGFAVRGRGVLQGERFRTDLDYYDLVAQHRNEPGVVYLVQARFPRAMAGEMMTKVNDLWRSFQLSGPRAYPTRC
jgi:hypothetical protein